MGAVAVNPVGGSGAKEGRDSACTPEWLARLIGRVDYDPCSNPRSNIRADVRVMLEDSGNGLAGNQGQYHRRGRLWSTHSDSTTFVNPPYARGQVIQWVHHWQDTDFIFLLRWDPSTDWFAELFPLCRYIWFPNQRINFEPPPGVTFSSNPYPHALYLRSKPNEALLASGWTMRTRGLATTR